MSAGYISFINASSRFSDAELQSAIQDFQSQVSGEFHAYWGFDAYLDEGGYGTPIFIIDYPGPNDPQNALGYHWIDPNYQPYAVVFAGLCEDLGYPVTGVLSHELLELLADQLADTADVYDAGDGTGVIVLQEVCDPVEQSLYYEGPNGNPVSDFALPDWYAPGSPGPYDYLGQVQGPWQLLSGGYVTYAQIQLNWQQATADTVAKIAGKLREHAQQGDPRTDLLRRRRAEAAQTLAAQAMGERRPVPAGAAPSQAADGSRVATMEGRQQAAKRQADGVVIVPRQEVPSGHPESGRARQDVQFAGPKAQVLR